MDDVIRWIESLLEAEYEALRASFVERDDARYRAKKDAYDAMLGEGMESSVRRPKIPNEDWFKIGEAAVQGSGVAKRCLYQVKRYRHPKFGELIRAYVGPKSEPAPGRAGYSALLFVAEFEGVRQVVSWYARDIICQQEGIRLEDGGLSWIWESGVSLDTLGRLEEVRRLTPPEVAEDLSEYEHPATE